MSYEEFDAWYCDNGVSRTSKWENGIEYELVTMTDGWIAVFERQRGGEYVPCIQTSDMAHAESFMYMREPITVPCNILFQDDDDDDD